MSNKKYYHSKGQSDAARGKYKAPHGILDSLTTWSSSGMDRQNANNKSYNQGWKNAKSQKRK